MLRENDPSEQEPWLDTRWSGDHPFELRVLWTRKLLILVIFSISLGLGLLYCAKASPIYRSHAQVLLVKKDAGLPAGGAGAQRTWDGLREYEQNLSTHMLLVCSPVVISRAVEKCQLASLPSLANVTSPVNEIIANLKASRAGDRATPDPNIFELSYQGPNPEDCCKIIAALAQSYQAYLGETYQNTSEETVKLVSQAKDVLHQQLREREAAYRTFRQESPLMWKGPEGVNLHESRLAEIEKARSQAMLECAQIEGGIETLQRVAREGAHSDLAALLADNSRLQAIFEKCGLSSSARERIVSARIEEQELLSKYGPKHPSLDMTRRKLDLLREFGGGSSTKEDGTPRDPLTACIESLRQEVETSRDRLAKLDKLFDQERRSAKELAAYQIEDETYRSEISRTQQMFNAVIRRLEEMNLMKDYGWISAQVIYPAEAGIQIYPRWALLLLLAGILGIIVGAGVAYLLERYDRRFASPLEIRQQLGLPVVGHIPRFKPEPTGEGAAVDGSDEMTLDPMLCVHNSPRSHAAESYRALRTALYFTADRERHRVLQITSPNPSDGKTTVASNLAASIADSGRKVLLVDADFRRPRIAERFAVHAQNGFAAVLAGECSISDAVYPTAVDGLWIMPAGSDVAKPAELLASPRLQPTLEAMRLQYDFVILDSPPVLAVADACIVAAQVDALFLVLRVCKEARESAVHALELLQGLKGNILGVVVNGVDQRVAGIAKKYSYYHAYNYHSDYARADAPGRSDPHAKSAVG